VYEYTGNLAAARQYYEAAVSLSPAFDLAWYNLAVVAARQQNRQLAAEAYAQFKALNPSRARSLPLPPGVQQ